MKIDTRRPNLVSLDSVQSEYKLYKPDKIEHGFAIPVNQSSIDFVSLTNWDSVEVVDIVWVPGR